MGQADSPLFNLRSSIAERAFEHRQRCGPGTLGRTLAWSQAQACLLVPVDAGST